MPLHKIYILSHDDMDVFWMEDLAELLDKSFMSRNVTGFRSLLVWLQFLQGVFYCCSHFGDLKIKGTLELAADKGGRVGQEKELKQEFGQVEEWLLARTENLEAVKSPLTLDAGPVSRLLAGVCRHHRLPGG